MKTMMMTAAMALMAMASAFAGDREDLQAASGYTAYDGPKETSNPGSKARAEMDMYFIEKKGYRYYGGWGEYLATGRHGPGVPGSNEPGLGDPGGAPNKGDCNCGR